MAINPDKFILLSSTVPDFEVLNKTVSIAISGNVTAGNSAVFETTPIPATTFSVNNSHTDTYAIIPTGWSGGSGIPVGSEINGNFFYIALEAGGGAIVGLIAQSYARISGETMIPGIVVTNNGTMTHTIPNTVVTVRAIARHTPPLSTT